MSSVTFTNMRRSNMKRSPQRDPRARRSPAAASHGVDGDESASPEAVQIGEADGGGRGIGGWFGLS